MLAIIPVNSRLSAKRRLDPLLTAGLRAELVEVMLADVVTACIATSAVRDVLVVTPDPSIAPAGVGVLVDRGRGHAAAISEALAGCEGEGAVVVMADCPLVRPDALALLCDSARPVALCPAQDGGTNALALRPAEAVQPAFGIPDGARVVVERAREAGVDAVVIEDDLLALDIDHPDDLERVRELGAGTLTARFLDRVLAGSAESVRSAR